MEVIFLKNERINSKAKAISSKEYTKDTIQHLNQTKVWTSKTRAGVQTLVWFKWYIFFQKSLLGTCTK